MLILIMNEKNMKSTHSRRPIEAAARVSLKMGLLITLLFAVSKVNL